MSEDDFYALVKRMLKPTKTPTVWLDDSGEIFHVPLAKDKSPDERRAIINRLKLMCGVDW